MHLIDDPWIPVCCAHGAARIIRPSDIGTASNPVTAIDWPRPDFRLACIEFLIGLLAIACPPDDEDAWLDWWIDPPEPATLAAKFAPFAGAFGLDGDGPRFMQDLEDLPGEPDLPETLLIEAPGDATRRNNTTLLNKPDRVRTLCRSAGAMALFTLQTYAPSGGRGNLTSVRGGGPLTTLVLPGAASEQQKTLWHMVWANVPYGKPVTNAQMPYVLPWLAATRTADRYPATTPAEAHELQAFWGMPRRIRLDFAPNPDRLHCDLTDGVDDVIVTGWRQRPNGVKYVAFEHPLSPYYKDAKGGWLPVHPQPGGIGYRDFVALAFEADKTTGQGRAACISRWIGRANPHDVGRAVRDRTRLLAGGYDMDNMKARSFIESEMPLPGSGPDAAERQVEPLARGLVTASKIVAGALRMAIRDAVLTRDTGLESAPLATAYEGFFAATQDAFFAALRRTVASAADDDGDPNAALMREAEAWKQLLRTTALRLFDGAAPLDAAAVSFDPRRIVEARRNLAGTLAGFGKLGSQLSAALLLPDRDTTPRRGRKGKGDSS